MNKKLFLTITFALAISFSMCLCASAATKLTVNGQAKDVVAYNIKGNNYFKLRDVANLLNGTNAQFDVIWDDEKKAINLKSNTAYSTNDSISLDEIKDPVATGTTSTIYKDGGKILAGAYNISGNNYFKLRDLAAIFNFGVIWDDETKTIGIDTSKPYEYPAATSEFKINPEIISCIGKTKAEMDALFGEPTPIMKNVYSFAGISKELGGDKYSNGVTVSYDTSNELKPVTKVEAPMSMMFYNCPENVERGILDAAFYETNIGGEWDFQANVYGGTLEVYLKGGSIASSENATLSYSTYPSEMTEVVYVGKEWLNTATKNYARLYKEYFEKEFASGRFSKDSDPYPFFGYYDFNNDGISELAGYYYGDGYTRSFIGKYCEIFSIINGNVVPLYRLGENESISYYDAQAVNSVYVYDLKIVRFADDNTYQYYTLDINTGSLTLYSTIKVVFAENYDQNTRIWLNGNELAYGTEAYDNALQNWMYNYPPERIGTEFYGSITQNKIIKS